MTDFVRPHAEVLKRRLAEPRRFIQVVAGPRQVGKTTLVQQVVGTRRRCRSRYASADEPTLRGADWIDAAVGSGAAWRRDAADAARCWSSTRSRRSPAGRRRSSASGTRTRAPSGPLKVVLLGSAPLLIQRGLTESLAGRFEVLRLPHWSFAEMREAFGFSLEQYLFYGGYPGAAPLVERARRAGRATSSTRSSRPRSRATCCCSRAWTSRRCCAGCSSSAAATPGRSSPTPRCSASCRTPATPRRSRTTSSCSRARAWSTGLQKFAGEAVAPARLQPQAAGAQHRAA